MTTDSNDIEARLRQQLPELADAYEARSAAMHPIAAEVSANHLMDDQFEVDTSTDSGTAGVARLLMAGAAAVLCLVVALQVLGIGAEEKVATGPADGAATFDGVASDSDPNPESTDGDEAASSDESKADASRSLGDESSTSTSTSIDETAEPASASDEVEETAEVAEVDVEVEVDGCVGNRVWNDSDSDGIQDPGEPGMIGPTISLIDEAGAVVDAMTLFNGFYSLCGPVGSYKIVVEIPAGYEVVAADQGTSDHKDSDALSDGSIAVAVEKDRRRSLFDIGLTPSNGATTQPDRPSTEGPSTESTSTPTTVDTAGGSTTPTDGDATADIPTPVANPTSRPQSRDELAWGFWVETRNAYPDNGYEPKVDAGVETIFDNYSFAHVKANSLHAVGGDTTDRTYVVNVIREAERTNTVLDLQLGSSAEYGWNFSTGRGNFSLDRWRDAVSRFAGTDRPSLANPRTTIDGDPAADAAIQRAIDNGTIRYLFLIDEPNHRRWSPQWNGKHGSAATGSTNYVTNRMLDQMAAHAKSIWGDHTQTIVRTSPTNLITASRGGIYRFEHMTHAYLTISSTKWRAGASKGPGKGLEWFLTEKDNHTAGLTNFSAFSATNLQMSFMVQAGFNSVGNPWTGEPNFSDRWWQGSVGYPYRGQTSYVKTAPGEMDYWIKSMLSKRDPVTGVLDPAGVRWIDDFSIFRADRLPTDNGRLPFSRYPHYRSFLDQLAIDLEAGNLDPVVGIPIGWRGQPAAS